MVDFLKDLHENLHDYASRMDINDNFATLNLFSNFSEVLKIELPQLDVQMAICRDAELMHVELRRRLVAM